jgi:sigma-B regulation protein RsbU (phosphoserine phosphatase)
MGKFAGLISEDQLSIIDGMIDWVRVIDRNNNVFYANKKMQNDLGKDIVGSKCYEILCRNKKCENCISHETLQNGVIQKKEEYLNDRTYMVVSSPMYNEYGEILGSVEVFRDITNEKLLSKRINEKSI